MATGDLIESSPMTPKPTSPMVHQMNRDAGAAQSAAQSAHSGTLRWAVSPAKQLKKSGGKGSVALLKNSKQ